MTPREPGKIDNPPALPETLSPRQAVDAALAAAEGNARMAAATFQEYAKAADEIEAREAQGLGAVLLARLAEYQACAAAVLAQRDPPDVDQLAALIFQHGAAISIRAAELGDPEDVKGLAEAAYSYAVQFALVRDVRRAEAAEFQKQQRAAGRSIERKP